MPALAHDDLLRRAKALDLPDRHHIDGVDEPGGGASFAVVSPRDGHVLVEVADASSAEVDLAVAAARRAFDSGPGPASPRPTAAGSCSASPNSSKSSGRSSP